MGRPPLYDTAILIRMTAQMRDAIAAARRDGETAADVVRAAIERELRARKITVQKPKPPARQRAGRTVNG